MAGGDIRRRLLPGQSETIDTPGDYIYIKTADRPVRVIISQGTGSGSSIIMQAGDKHRPGPFAQFTIENPDRQRPAQVVLVVGQGDFNRQIVQGEVVVDPRIKTADGSYVADQRETHYVSVTMDYRREPTATKNNCREIVAVPRGDFPVRGTMEGLTWDGEAYKVADFAFSGSNGARYHAVTVTPA